MEQVGSGDRMTRIASKYGDLQIKDLRLSFGPALAPGVDGGRKLSEVLSDLDGTSLAFLESKI